MPIDKEYRGKVFVQIAPRLRWTDGRNGEVESFRPIDEKTGQVIGDPPLITFDDGASFAGNPLDIGRFLATGRIKLSEDQSVKAPKPMTDAEAHTKPKPEPAPLVGEGG